MRLPDDRSRKRREREKYLRFHCVNPGTEMGVDARDATGEATLQPTAAEKPVATVGSPDGREYSHATGHPAPDPGGGPGVRDPLFMRRA